MVLSTNQQIHLSAIGFQIGQLTHLFKNSIHFLYLWLWWCSCKTLWV